MKAKTVRDVVLGEAKAGDIEDMEHIASVISNRARELGISEQDVVASGDFDAYGKTLPSGVTKFAKQAEAAIAKVAKDGPVTNATYYATPDRASNLGRKVTKTGMVAKTKGHQYYAAPLKAGVSLGQTAVAQAPQGGLAAFFSDPLGLQAQAAEAPAGLAAFAAPDTKQQAQIDYFGSVPTTDWSQQREEAIAQRTATPALSDPSFNSRFAANQPALSAPSFDARFGAPAAPDASRFAPGLAAPQGPVSPEQYASAVPASAKARSAFDAIAAGLGAPGISTQPEGLGSLAGSMVGPAPDEAPMTTDAKGTYATPFGPSQFGVAAQASEMPAEASAFTEQPASVTTQAMRDSVAAQPGAVSPALSSPQTVKDYNVVASQTPTAPTAPNGLAAVAPTQLGGLLGSGIAKMGLYGAQHPEDPELAGATIADPNTPATEIGPQGQTIAGGFPAAPEEDSLIGPNTKRALAGLMLGGPIGGLLGAASGMISGGLGSLGGPAGVAQDHETFAAGSGLGGMQQGMYGERGATGRSRSQPGVFATSRGPNQGYDLNNQFGARTTYGPSGDIRANSGTMDAWGRVLGGLFDRPDKSKKGQSGRGLGGLSQAGRDAVGKGLGGLY